MWTERPSSGQKGRPKIVIDIYYTPETDAEKGAAAHTHGWRKKGKVFRITFIEFLERWQWRAAAAPLRCPASPERIIPLLSQRGGFWNGIRFLLDFQSCWLVILAYFSNFFFWGTCCCCFCWYAAFILVSAGEQRAFSFVRIITSLQEYRNDRL